MLAKGKNCFPKGGGKQFLLWLTFTSLLEPIFKLRHGVEKEIRAKPCSAGRPRPDPPKVAAEILVIVLGASIW